MKFFPRVNSLKPWLFLLFTLLSVSIAQAMPFGINKVRYHTNQHWKIYQTEHFEIYYYLECESIAKAATRYAEDAFLKTSKLFDYVPHTKIPLFIYGTPAEFQETNVTPQFLPEGVGGFTEVFKNRIAVPMNGSYHEFEKVIIHELTHAFQYDLIYGEGWRSMNLFKAVFAPNWMMEGLAEWNAQHWENQGEMVLRDAILNDQLVPLEWLESFGHFEQVYTAYKESQSILEYVSQVYGPDKVVQMMKRMTTNQQPDSVVRSVLGISLNELYANWHFYVKSKAWSRINGLPAPERYGALLAPDVAKAAVSPDGSRVACLNGGELRIMDTITKESKTILNRQFQIQGSGVAWSPDGKLLAFAANRNGEYGLYTIDVKTRETKECKVPKMPLVYSPAWSSDQKYLLFSGFDYSTVDLYRYEMATQKVDRLTNNSETESWASYTTDGKSVYFLREMSGETSIMRMDLDAQGLSTGAAVPVGRDLGGISSFRIVKDSLYLTSNRNLRIFNLYRMGLDGGHLTQLTNTFTDLLNAAPSPDASTFYASIYQRSRQSLYALEGDKLEKTENPPLRLGFLSNSFEDAEKLIAAATVKGPKEADPPIRPEGGEPENTKDKKPPTKAPRAVAHLEVAESSNIVQIQWPAFLAEGETVENYRVYRATADGHFTQIGSTPDAKKGKYVDYDVKSGGTYSYYVTAVNQIGESEPSPVAEAHTDSKVASKDYDFQFSPDILLFLAGYDSSFGFVGGGVFQFSDYMGNHRLGVIGDTIPGVRTGLEANYQFSQWRTTVDVNFFYYQNFFRVFDLQSGNLVNEYRNNENGLDLNFSYPLNTSTRVEYGLGTQRFQGSPRYLRFSEGISNYFQNSDQWNIANYYRLAFIQDKRLGTRFWPSGGYSLNFTLLHALPVLDSNVSFANLLLEGQVFADIGFLDHLIVANRFIGMSSQGPNPQSFFIGNDAPFQAFFTTIRGYGADSFFGSNLALWNMELRYPLATNINFPVHPLPFIMLKDVELAGFLDAGVVSNHLQDLPDSKVLASIGTGIRFYAFLYQRALVMLRFDVAWRLDQAAPPTFNFNLTPIF
jgi:hypothetical protein